jgi:hypothetical protein
LPGDQPTATYLALVARRPHIDACAAGASAGGNSSGSAVRAHGEEKERRQEDGSASQIQRWVDGGGDHRPGSAGSHRVGGH